MECPTLEPLDNGVVNCSTTSPSKFGTICLFKCNRFYGYKDDSKKLIKCTAGPGIGKLGKWTGSIPFCESKKFLLCLIKNNIL